MKKAIVFAAALALVLGLAGCSQPAQSESSASASAEPSSSASVSAEAPEIKWNQVKSAEEAAKGAGFETFGVFKKITIDDMTFEKPQFSYADGTAQAAYETGATGLYVRKADGKHTTPLSDRVESDFAEKWTKTYEGLDVSLFGPAKGAATLMTWKDGTKEYGVTFQGLGGEEMTMDSDETAQIVKDIVAAEAKAAGADKEKSAEAKSDASQNSGYISEDDAKSAAVSYLGLGLPETVVAELVVGGDAPHYEVTCTFGTEEHLVEVDAITGEVWANEPPVAEADDDDDDDDADDDADDDDDDDYNFISEDDAKSSAVASVNAGLPDEVDAELVVGGDAPHYDVTLDYNGDEITVQVDAYTGEVW